MESVGRGVGLYNDLVIGSSEAKLTAAAVTEMPRHFENAWSYVLSCVESFRATSAWPSITSQTIIVLLILISSILEPTNRIFWLYPTRQMLLVDTLAMSPTVFERHILMIDMCVKEPLITYMVDGFPEESYYVVFSERWNSHSIISSKEFLPGV